MRFYAKKSRLVNSFLKNYTKGKKTGCRKSPVGKNGEIRSVFLYKGKVIHRKCVLSTILFWFAQKGGLKKKVFVDSCRVKGKLSTVCPQYVDIF